jgi:hypothetical protein
MPKTPKQSKQLRLDSLSIALKNDQAKTTPLAQEKQIMITEIDSLTKEDEVALKVGFKLVPSKATFSKVQTDLWFDNQKISSVSIRIPQGSLAADEFELTPVLDMKGIPAGSHTLKVEMYELWVSGERLSQTTKEVTLDYMPQTRESRLVKVPSVKSVAGDGLAVISESEKDVYREIEKTIKKEQLSKRDDW